MRNPFYISLQKTGESQTIEKLRTNLWDEENRLRAVDITPDAEGVRPIAIYTYDAGGERVLKHSNTSVSIYLNGKKVADTIQVDATLYPSGMTVFRPSFGGGGSYTKHYYAGTQRVSSKIGTTENLGDYLYDWFTQGTGGPVDVIGSSFGVLENAEQGVVQVYDELGIDSPTYESNPVFIPVQSFVHGGNEVEQYFFHPDHLGSTSYITNLLGEVSQHMEYFAFGETFVEEHRSSNNSPYKFNGKELDEETGWYYYGARYYDPRISVWLSVDPLANVDYLMNDEAYINGEHNGGIYNSFNHNSYVYTYQNPLRYIDPNGKQVDVTLPDNPANIDMSIWENYTPEKHTGHTQYWRHRESGIFLAHDGGDKAHYHLYEDSKFKTRLDANGVKSGTKLGNIKLSKGATRFHLKGGSKINMSAISNSLGKSLNVLGTIGMGIDIFKIFSGNPSTMFSSFNPSGNLNTVYGISSSDNLFEDNLYYEIKSRNKDNSIINVDFFNDYYYDHDSDRYRGKDKYDSGTLKRNEDGSYKVINLKSEKL